MLDTVRLHSNILLKPFFSGIFILASCFVLFSQNSKDLDSKKKENIQKLQYSRSLLEKTEASKNLTLNQLNLIQQNIELREGIIVNISDELSFLRSNIEENILEINRLEERVKQFQNEYASLVLAASRNLDNDYALMYLFSSEDFNQAYQRIKYLKYLARYRSDLVEKLKIEEENLVRRNSELVENKRKNEILLTERQRELSSLDRDKKKNVTLIRSLQSKESELKADIKKRERIQSEIEKEIRRLIEEEISKAKVANKPNVLTPEEKIISGDFYKNMGRLPWPSEQCVITGKYGEQSHPVLKGIKIKSNGIDINTVEGAKVRTVYEGEVTKVIAILGANYTVIIKHGEYRTVYQNLIDVKVKAGDKLKTKDIIGTVFTDLDKNTKFHFEVWKDKVILNPELWLSK